MSGSTSGKRGGRGNVVFVSSTCDDLIDVRRELDVFLRGLGLTPFISDSEAGSYQIDDPVTKLAICRARVRQARCVVVILSQRYGTTASPEGLSYTQEEYGEALDKGIPICFFVRNTLWEAYEEWRGPRLRGSLPNCPWVGDNVALGQLLRFIEKHDQQEDRVLVVFRSVVDLKTQLQHYLRGLWVMAQYEEAKAAGRLPLVQVAFGQRPEATAPSLHLTLTNIGAAPALFLPGSGIYVREKAAKAGTLGRGHKASSDWSPERPAVLRPGDVCGVRLNAVSGIRRQFGDSFELCIAYGTVQGHQVLDVYRLELNPADARKEWDLFFVAKELDERSEKAEAKGAKEEG